jgi:hypothetical protein
MVNTISVTLNYAYNSNECYNIFSLHHMLSTINDDDTTLKSRTDETVLAAQGMYMF